MACSVCLEPFDFHSSADIVGLPCTHVFHGRCVAVYYDRSGCPKCRHKAADGAASFLTLKFDVDDGNSASKSKDVSSHVSKKIKTTGTQKEKPVREGHTDYALQMRKALAAADAKVHHVAPKNDVLFDNFGGLPPIGVAPGQMRLATSSNAVASSTTSVATKNKKNGVIQDEEDEFEDLPELIVEPVSSTYYQNEANFASIIGIGSQQRKPLLSDQQRPEAKSGGNVQASAIDNCAAISNGAAVASTGLLQQAAKAMIDVPTAASTPTTEPGKGATGVANIRTKKRAKQMTL